MKQLLFIAFIALMVLPACRPAPGGLPTVVPTAAVATTAPSSTTAASSTVAPSSTTDTTPIPPPTTTPLFDIDPADRSVFAAGLVGSEAADALPLSLIHI